MMQGLPAKVAAFCDRHALLPAGSAGIVGLSGGADSLALLDVLRALSAGRGLRLHAVTVDHGLRPTSGDEASCAAELARSSGVPAEIVRVALAPGGNVEERAREARLAALEQARRRLDADWIALGHTADDQAETVLLRLLRGAGPRGLAAMAPRRGPFVRPLLSVGRAELTAWLTSHGRRPQKDPSNDSPRFARNRLRAVLLPSLVAENPRAVASLCRLADSCREEHEALEALARAALQQHGSGGALALGELRGAPAGLRHLVWALAFEQAAGDRRQLSRRHLEAIDRLCSDGRGTAWLDLPGLRVERRYDELRWPVPASMLEPCEVTAPGCWSLGPAGELEVREEVLGRDRPDALPRRLLRPPLSIRSFSGGERLKIALQHHRKVGRLLIDHKVPRSERTWVPLVYHGDELVMVVGVRRAAGWGCEPGDDAWVFRQHPRR